MTSPCKDCQDRHAHCHSACNRYGEYAAMFEKIRAQRLADAALLHGIEKPMEQCPREAAALGLTYGQYVQRGYDKECL